MEGSSFTEREPDARKSREIPRFAPSVERGERGCVHRFFQTP